MAAIEQEAVLVIKPHHLLHMLQACPAYAKHFVPEFESPITAGYSTQHTTAIKEFYAHIAKLPPDTPIITDFTPDGFCEPCPKNVSGKHRDPSLYPCDPLGHLIEVTDQVALSRLEAIQGSRRWDRFCDTLEKHHWRLTPDAQIELDNQPELIFTVADLLPGLKTITE